MPKSNLAYWQKKINRNKKRDIEVNESLSVKGWKVVRLWETDIKKDFNLAITTILKALGMDYNEVVS